eukprot:FR734917.1.p2 GENE.FR734917.1~~FR734917.1.p2  ORF type:complete len:110 (+),score=83.65 FR734917.1:922-1251(+)
MPADLRRPFPEARGFRPGGFLANFVKRVLKLKPSKKKKKKKKKNRAPWGGTPQGPQNPRGKPPYFSKRAPPPPGGGNPPPFFFPPFCGGGFKFCRPPWGGRIFSVGVNL